MDPLQIVQWYPTKSWFSSRAGAPSRIALVTNSLKPEAKSTLLTLPVALDGASRTRDRRQASRLQLAAGSDATADYCVRTFARCQVTVAVPPAEAAATVYLSSSLLNVRLRFISDPSQFGNVARSGLKVMVLSESFTT